MSSKSNRSGFKKRAWAKNEKSKARHGKFNSNKKKERDNHSLRRKIGYTITTLMCIILIIGTIGISPERPTRNIPNTPPSVTNGTVFFAPVAVPDNPFSSLLSTDLSLTWDRNDVFLVIADGDKKDQCNSLSLLEKIQSTSTICKAEDDGYETIGLNNSTGIEWTINDGDYFFGIGTLGESDTDRSGLRLFISVEMKLSITGYMLFFSLGAIGLAIIKDRKIIH